MKLKKKKKESLLKVLQSVMGEMLLVGNSGLISTRTKDFSPVVLAGVSLNRLLPTSDELLGCRTGNRKINRRRREQFSVLVLHSQDEAVF